MAHSLLTSKTICRSLIKELHQVRHQKVNTIKDKLSSGSYNIKSTSIAKALCGLEGKKNR